MARSIKGGYESSGAGISQKELPILSSDDRAALLEVADKKTKKTVFELRQCIHCGGVHDRACPRVKRMVLAPSGQLLEVEFWKDWDDSYVIYPEMLGVVEETAEPKRE